MIPDREKLSWVIDETPDDVPFTVTPWHEDTPMKLVANVAEYIIGCETAALVGLECLITKKPLHEALWDAFSKQLSDGKGKGNSSRSY